MAFVHVGVYSGSTEEVVDEHVWQQRTDSIIASWKATDGESGIETYSVCVGTSPGQYHHVLVVQEPCFLVNYSLS